ncbi:flagellin N-terminal helical domain-containing protein [Tranquillimonas alkanivorans]|uniref:Flagellin n=1 Tax=Tranquillimonas alkanivorans TaxID=441119 RepID=A0A1I5S4P2_9RHOB|nr:flagellin [Tranquillimonas alkanivorans]SFP65725.1 flagellar hook-associated protein 3 FlgL [Tranquillimonas alkanivorans]
MSSIVNTFSSYYAGLSQRRTVAELNGELTRAAEEVSTGLKADVYRALGRRSAESLSLHDGIRRTEDFVTSNTLLSGRLDIAASALKSVRETGQEVLDLAASNRSAPSHTATTLQSTARAALEALQPQLNASYNRTSLFAGTATAGAPVQPWSEVNPGTGLSPQEVLEGVVGGGFADAADAAAKAAEVAALFDGSNADRPERNFKATFYNGTPQAQADGTPSPRQSARVAEDETLEYGVQANDPAFRDLLRGLSMMAAVDVSRIEDPNAYAAWMEEAFDALQSGTQGVLEAETRLGAQQARLERTLTGQQDRMALYNSQVLELEGVDPYEAASRMSELQTQLEASYAVTARLSKLSFLNFM